MYLYILRHGTTKWNMEHLIQGQTDTELDEFGRLMAVETAKGLAREGITFDKVYSSPLSRSYETAKLVAPDSEIIVDERLKELSFGFMDGGKVEVMAADESCPFRFFKSAPDRYEEEVRKLCGFDSSDVDLVSGASDLSKLDNSIEPPELLSDLCARARSFLEEVIEPYVRSGSTDRSAHSGITSDDKADEKFLISTHGALSKALLMHIRGESDLSKFWGDGLLPNCGFAVVSVEAVSDSEPDALSGGNLQSGLGMLSEGNLKSGSGMLSEGNLKSGLGASVKYEIINPSAVFYDDDIKNKAPKLL